METTTQGLPVGRTMTDENFTIPQLLKKMKGHAFMISTVFDPEPVRYGEGSIYVKISFAAAKRMLQDLQKKGFEIVEVTIMPGYAPMIFFNKVVRGVLL